MKRESVVIESFLIDKPKQVKIFEVRIPREVESIIGVELSCNLFQVAKRDGYVSGILIPPAPLTPAPMKTDFSLAATRSETGFPISFKRNICVGELRLQSYSKLNLFYAGELVMDRNIDNADFTSGFFPPQAYTHQKHFFETEVKLSSKNRIIRGIYRDSLSNNVAGRYKYQVNLYLWTTKLVKEDKQ